MISPYHLYGSPQFVLYATHTPVVIASLGFKVWSVGFKAINTLYPLDYYTVLTYNKH